MKEKIVFVYEDCNSNNFLDVEKLIVEKIKYYKISKIKTFENQIISSIKN